MIGSKKIMLYLLCGFIAFGFYYYIVDDYRAQNNDLHYSGKLTTGIVIKKKLNTNSIYWNNRYWEIDYKFQVDSNIFYSSSRIYNLLTRKYHVKDTIFVLYANYNPKISRISFTPISNPEKINLIQAMIEIPQLGLIDIGLFFISIVTLLFIIMGILWLLIKIKDILVTTHNPRLKT